MKRRATKTVRTRPRVSASARNHSNGDTTLTVLDALPEQIAVIDARGVIVAVNKAWREFASTAGARSDRGALGDDYLSRSTSLHANAPQLMEFADGVRAVLSGKRNEFEIEYPWRVGGDERWFHARVTSCRAGTTQAVIAHEDISERVRLEREIVAVSAREQQRLRQELHDGLSQQLTGLKFKATLLEYKLQAKDLAEADDAKALSLLLNEATEEASQLARQLRPVEVEGRGLMMALRELALNTEQRQKVRCEVSIARPVFIHDNNTATNLFRIAQEAVNAAVSQGEAQRVTITLKEAGNLLTLTVRDNGRKLKERVADDLGPHLLRYHARILGGTLEWQNHSPRGVVFTFCFRKHAFAPE